MPPVPSYYSDIFWSFIIEFVFTTILLLVIFLNFDPTSSYRKTLSFNSFFTGGPIITGLVLMILIYLAVTIYAYTGISAGHMFPLITIPGMFPKGAGFATVTVGSSTKISYVKGFFMLFGQFLAMGLAWSLVFYFKLFS